MSNKNNKKLTVLVTGTTSGIGYSLCKVFARRGDSLILVSRDRKKLERQRRELEKYIQDILIFPIDLNTENAAQKILDFVESEHKQVDVLVNNAGFGESGEFITVPIDKESEMIELHNKVLTEMTKLFSRKMIRQKKGYILNLGSIGSFAPFPFNAVYTASKAYILNFSLAIGTELSKRGVFVSTLCPGATNTLFAQKAGLEKTFLFQHFVMSPDKVASVAVKGLLKKKRVIIPGIYNKFLFIALKITPYFILEKISPNYFKEVS